MTNAWLSQGLDATISIGIFALAVTISLCLILFGDRGSQNAMTNHFAYIEGMRACAALLVVCCHAVVIFRYLIDGTYGSAVPTNMGSLGVQIFFAITAYLFIGKVLRSGPINPLSFAVGRFKRLVPMYTFSILIATLLCALYTGALASAEDYLNLYAQGFVSRPSFMLGSVNAVQVIGTIWTLPYEWQFYIALPIIAYAFSPRYMTLGLIVAFLALAIYSFRHASDVLWVFFIPGAIAAFLRAKVRHVSVNVAKTLSFVAAAVVLTAIFTDGVQTYVVKRLILMTVFMCCVVLAEPKILCSRPLAYLGKISYSIYLLQLPCIFVSRWVLQKSAFFSTGAMSHLTVLFFVAMIIVISSVTYRFVEAPFMHSARSRFSTSASAI